MKGTITKKDFIAVWKEFGFQIAMKLLFSRNKEFLEIVMEG